jgi:hypothetical protein
MARKPPNLIYGVEDQPTGGVTLTLGFQHVFRMVSTLILPVAVVQEINGTPEQVVTCSYISITERSSKHSGWHVPPARTAAADCKSVGNWIACL